VDVVVIGAIAYRAWTKDDKRTTEDLDAAVALDMDRLPLLTDLLVARGWRQDGRREHRWFSAAHARVDLLPVGPRARKAKEIIWPGGQTRMSVVGFDHVFKDAVEFDFGSGLTARVVPLPVLVLLKIVSFLDGPYARQKDLQDFGCILASYEEDGERRFSDEVLDAGLNYDCAGPYLLGRDLGKLCDQDDERAVVKRFIQQISDEDHFAFSMLRRLSRRGLEDDDKTLVDLVQAFARGFGD
jgi:predicted nucleotidyltransferase